MTSNSLDKILYIIYYILKLMKYIFFRKERNKNEKV